MEDLCKRVIIEYARHGSKEATTARKKREKKLSYKSSEKQSKVSNSKHTMIFIYQLAINKEPLLKNNQLKQQNLISRNKIPAKIKLRKMNHWRWNKNKKI